MSNKTSTDRPYLSEAASAYLAYLRVQGGRSENTVRAYARDIYLFESALADGSLQLTEITPEVVERFLEDISRRFSDRTALRIQSSVRGYCRFLFSDGYLQSYVEPRNTMPRPPETLPKVLGSTEIIELLESVSGDSPKDLRDRAVLELLYGTGMRISELCGLQLWDVDPENTTIKVYGKGSKERIVPLGAPGASSLAAYMSRGRPSLSKGSKTGYLFLNLKGSRLTRQGAWLVIKSRASQVGLGSKITPHTLRHCCASHMLEGGADLRVVQELLGHASLSTTQIYTKVTLGHIREIYITSHPRSTVRKLTK
ncbi:integrase/recombinase XerD [Ferrithrix thermotolerans DSM 19514]|uniref:Tyrosine recombinase XerC n=1 Tax=Ferrithrix thermotolerans DSM 19514 TaxID=1121881 RepID=A0A1M4XB71_9ACTN|nr:tyrosine recombinase [Ferrithrix thermotolerans]SHE90655.1 integrase/recombinase XerD [Ferrithrix thermotolerans DSM 19514]